MRGVNRVFRGRAKGDQPPSLPRKIAMLLRRRGADAHVYMPGRGMPVLGPELLANGNLDSDTVWGKDQATISGGVATITNAAAGVGVLQQGGLTLVAGRTYQCTFTVNSINTSGGGLSLRIGGADSTVVSTPGTYSFPVVYDGTSAVFMVRTRFAAVTAQFDNLSLKEITGYTSWLNGFQAGNYLESTGNTNAALDGAVGLVLDAAGSVGAELAVGGDFSSAANWSVQAGLTVSGGALSVNAGGGAITNTAGQSAVIGKTYRLEYEITAFTSGQVKLFMGGQGGVAASAVGKYVSHVVATTTDKPQIYVTSGGTVLSVDNVSVKEVTGIHASQATTANKPTLRRGIVNLGMYSRPNSGQWQTGISGTGVAPTITHNYAASPDGSMTATRVQLNKGAGTTSADFSQYFSFHNAPITGRYTTALWARTTDGLPKTVTYRDGNSFGPITLDGTWKLILEKRDYTGQTPGMGLRLRGGETTDTTADLLVWDAGFFAGDVNALQVAAAGGIPLPTTAPASSQYGIGEPILGPELFPQPSLDSAVGIRVDAGWSVSGGVATAAGTNTVIGDIGSNYTKYTAGKLYQVGINVASRTAGQLQAYLRGSMVSGFSAVSATGWTYGTGIAGSSTTEGLAVVGINSFAGTVNDISVREILGYKSLPSAYAWEFDGSNDYIAGGAAPFQHTDDFVAVVAANNRISTGFPTLFAVNGAAPAKLNLFLAGGVPYVEFIGSTGSAGNSTNEAKVNVPFVLAARKSGNLVSVRLDGSHKSSFSTDSAVASALTGFGIGANTDGSGSKANGQIFGLIAIKGTVPDAELKLLEKWLGSIAGVPIA